MNEELVEDIVDSTISELSGVFQEIWKNFSEITDQLADLRRWMVFLIIATIVINLLIAIIIISYILKLKNQILILEKDNLKIQQKIISLIKQPIEDKDKDKEKEE